MEARWKLLIVALFAFLWKGQAASQVNKDSLLADFDLFVKYLDDTHPDPYTAFGGRPFFFKTIGHVRGELDRDASLTVEKLASSLAMLASRLHDGHTYVQLPAGQSVPNTPVALFQMAAANDGLMLSKVLAKDKTLLGSRVVSVNGYPMDKVAEFIGMYKPVENRFGVWAMFDRFINMSQWQQWISGMGSALKLGLVTTKGDSVTYSVPNASVADSRNAVFVSFNENPRLPKGFMEYKTVDRDGKVMMLKFPAVYSRENFAFMRNNKWDFYGQLYWFYKNVLKCDMPSDTLKAIEGIPSFPSVFRDMLLEMKAKNVPYLIVDLRGNGGGWTPIVDATVYQLYGDRYFTMKSFSDESVRRMSPLYLKKIKMTMADFNKRNRMAIKELDYIFEDGEDRADWSEEQKYKAIDELMVDDDTRRQLHEQHGKPLYLPKRVFVVTDVHTFSAAFHYTFKLWKMGAEVVGVTTSQAPNTYMENTPFYLPHSGIGGSISNYQQIFLPSTDPRARTFTPDLPVDYRHFAKYGFSSDASIAYILDLLKVRK